MIQGFARRTMRREPVFATDLRNLTLASPVVNRHRKSGKDAGEWLLDGSAGREPC